MRKTGVFVIFSVLALTVLVGCKEKKVAGTFPDEAQAVGRTAESLAGSDDPYLADMDYGVTNDPELVRQRLDPYVPGISPADAVAAVHRGRNNWNIWTAGNDTLWDKFATDGILDLLKTLSNHPVLGYSRDDRWQKLGLVNEPCFVKGEGPREDRFGLWLDVRDPACGPDPFEDETKYPGVKIGARGDRPGFPTGSYYGYATGVVGLRLLPNPAFDAAAEEDWDPEKFYTEPDYYDRKNLIRPYRVGMSCGFCHVGPSPTNPPADPEAPTWANLNSNPGAQYFWIDRVFIWSWNLQDPRVPSANSNFIYQLLRTSRPGALDTSLVSSDQINNPRTMNAVYNVGARVANAFHWGGEKLAGGGLNNKQFTDYIPPVPPNGALAKTFETPDAVWTPRVLKDGSDSVGVLGALNRVFINIGLFSEEWTLHFIPLLGGADITPIPIETLEKNSSYWRATESQTIDTALFFLATAQPDDLSLADPSRVLPEDDPKIVRGKEVFATTCARCHSSKLPQQVLDTYFPGGGCVGAGYLDCWNEYWAYTKTEEFKEAAKAIVLAPDFRQDNFLSTELRIPVTLLETNACSPLATNAIAGNIWDNFSSQSYKDLPSVGTIQVHHPLTGELREDEYVMPAGGRGYTRPASLVSLWSTAPYLLNNTVGEFKWTGSIDDRLASFEDGITKMLWPEKRDGNVEYMTRSGEKLRGIIDGTTQSTYLRVYTGYLPQFLQPLVGFGHRWFPWLFGEGGVELGPIPKGTPVNLLSNIDLQTPKVKLLELLIKIKRRLKELPENATDAEATAVFKDLVDPLLEVSKCPDFVINRGHYFGTAYLPANEGETPLSDEDKWALIEFLKTL